MRYSERLEVFDHGHSLVFGQPVSEGMPAVAPAWLRGVIDLAAVDCGEAGIGGVCQRLEPQPHPALVVLQGIAVEAAGYDSGALARFENVINCRHRAVVKVRCGRPDAVERRGLIAASAQAMIGLSRGTVLAGELALEVMRHAFRGEGVRQGGIQRR